MESSALLPWLQLLRVRGLGPVLINRLVREIGPPAIVLSCSPARLCMVSGIGPGVAAAIRQVNRGREAAQEAENDLQRLLALGSHSVTRLDADYPPLLAAIYDPPPVLHTLGDPALLCAEKLVAVVGSRHPSPHAQELAYAIGYGLAKARVVTVSGLAMGIDAAAHQGALDGGGATVAVTATGLDIPYPTPNQALRERIIRQGCLVTEAVPGTQPHPSLFPPRNRIISGLCSGVTVVAASERSGSLITAHVALEQGREVFAVPGAAADPQTRGSNSLLRDGATWVEDVTDILDGLGWDHPPLESLLPEAGAMDGDARAMDAAFPNNFPSALPVLPSVLPSQLPQEARLVMELLTQGVTHGDDLTRACRLTVGNLSSILLQLELFGLVVRLPGDRYALRPVMR